LVIAKSVFAECSKKEIIQFIEMEFSKEEIKKICNDNSIEFDNESDGKEEKSQNQTVIEAENIKEVDEEQEELTNEVAQKKKEVIKTLKNQQIVLEIGSLEGEYTMSSRDPFFGPYSEKLDHDLRGSAFMVSYQYNFRNLIVGAGYQSLSLSGESERVRETGITDTGFVFNLDLRIREDINIAGLFSLIGYEFTVFDNVELVPQFRWGFSNNVSIEITADLTATDLANTVSSSSSVSEKYESKTDVKIFALPVIYRYDSFGVGLNVYTVRNEFVEEFDTTTSTYQTKNGLLLSFGNKF